MPYQTVAVVAPGDMGHAVGQRLVEHGVSVITNLEGRSERSRAMAAAAGFADVGSDAALLERADLVMSIMPPGVAVDFVTRLAAAAAGTRKRPQIVDLNAVSPGTARRMEAIARGAGFMLTDGGIIGGPPKGGKPCPRLYVSGPGADELVALNAKGMDFRPLGPSIGAASAIKMSYATMTKGLTALAVQSWVTARDAGVIEALEAEMASSQPHLMKHVAAFVPSVPPKAYRWVAEMEEIARTAADSGLPADTFEGIARLYQVIEASPLGKEVVGERSIGGTTREVADVLSEYLSGRGAAAD